MTPTVSDANAQPKLLRKAELAKQYDICTKTIDRHIEMGIFPPPDFHVGRFPHWKDSTIEHWIETRKQI
jgi:predicted DNA-binding transcriptional regulator AlpA